MVRVSESLSTALSSYTPSHSSSKVAALVSGSKIRHLGTPAPAHSCRLRTRSRHKAQLSFVQFHVPTDFLARQLQEPVNGEEYSRAWFQSGHQQYIRLSPNPPMGGVKAGNWDEGAYKGESLGSIGTDVTRQRVFSSRTGPGERSMEAGNRVIVRPDAAGCTRGPGGREFGGVGSVADSAVRLGVGWLAVGPGREWPAQPRASPGEDAK